MGEKTIKQHYVQRKYLELYAGSDKIHVFDKSMQKTFGTNVRDVANERYFYDVPELDDLTGQSQFLEKYFHPFEGVGPEIMSKLVSMLDDGSFVVLDKDDRKQLSTYFAVQYLRTKESRVTSIEIVEKVLKEMAFALGGNKFAELGLKKDDLIAKVSEEKIPALHATHILDEELRDEIAEILNNHIWLVVANCTEVPLYTSDHPLVKKGHIKDSVLAMNGLSSPGIEIDFPLSPKYLISMVDRVHFKNYKEMDGKKVDVNNVDAITWYNHLQVYQSYRQVFCNTAQFDLVAEMISKNPDICKIDHDRVKVS